MGRTVPTFVQLIQQAADRWRKFRRALRREDQPHFDRLFVGSECVATHKQPRISAMPTIRWKPSFFPLRSTRRRGCTP